MRLAAARRHGMPVAITLSSSLPQLHSQAPSRYVGHVKTLGSVENAQPATLQPTDNTQKTMPYNQCGFELEGADGCQFDFTSTQDARLSAALAKPSQPDYASSSIPGGGLG